MRTLADEEHAPKSAPSARERRGRGDPDRPALDGAAHVAIEDRYIDGNRLRLRRMTDEASGALALKLTKKYDAVDPAARSIVTAYLTEAEFAVFAALPAAAVMKRRYAVGGFSLDVFAGALTGLELAEIEADSAAALAAIVPPRWFGREVSLDPRYTGGALAAAGRPET